MPQLLTTDDLPVDFDYPAEFIRAVELGVTDLEPWWIIQGNVLHDRYSGLRERYPARTLVPFAVRQDRDDVACWEGTSDRVVIIHDFADPGWEQREVLEGFNAWLRRAVEDFIEFGGG